MLTFARNNDILSFYLRLLRWYLTGSLRRTSCLHLRRLRTADLRNPLPGILLEHPLESRCSELETIIEFPPIKITFKIKVLEIHRISFYAQAIFRFFKRKIIQNLLYTQLNSTDLEFKSILEWKRRGLFLQFDSIREIYWN